MYFGIHVNFTKTINYFFLQLLLLTILELVNIFQKLAFKKETIYLSLLMLIT